MFCEKSVIHNSSYVYVAHCGRGDVAWRYRPLAERWNPLRYEIGIRADKRRGPVVWINRHGWMASRVANAVYWFRCHLKGGV
ncbi:MAG: hypothetical protein KGJ57_17495 [Sphingomonadales bacterium]|nr:hypothetical protein [Sphingomonadales bacterium]MDE2171193.1 hypothetical protein [Sphingomonadales bacterium]